MASYDRHSRAQFVPLSPNFDLHSLVQDSENINYAMRVPKDQIKHQSARSIEALISSVVIQGGKPLVIEGWGSSLPPSLFSWKWLENNAGFKAENVRDLSNETNILMTVGHYLRSMNQLTNQFTTKNYRQSNHQRLYLKDIDCPNAWANHLKSVVPGCIYHLNECIEYTAGESNTSCEVNQNEQNHSYKSVAPAGDLMSSLPSEMQALNLMCYIGHDGTYTAAHREMCATIGHNIMVETSKDNEFETKGCSIWFMTETKERNIVREYFSKVLGHDIDVEKHFAQLNAWKKAPFNVWVVEQKLGDLIIIPPLAPHQVWNRGTRTIKVAWNRTTTDTLELALHEALLYSRMVCRDEQYKCKAIIFYTLKKYYKTLQQNIIDEKTWPHGRIKELLNDFKRLFYLYREVLLTEMFSPRLQEEKIELLPYDSSVTCSYCRCDIFNRFLTCKTCNSNVSGELEDTYDICMDCYAMGRSCACISNLSWVEQWDWKVLEDSYKLWYTIIARFFGNNEMMRSLRTLNSEAANQKTKSTAEVCQQQLRLRPCENTTKITDLTQLSHAKLKLMEYNESKIQNKRRNSNIHDSKKMVSRQTKVKRHKCHICRRNDWNWKLAFCSNCNLAYCYTTLWRRFDLLPQAVMADSEWQCPRCLKICSCKTCCKDSTQTPYRPKIMLLGHNTKKIADYRSVECLVDFSKDKLIWPRNSACKTKFSNCVKSQKALGVEEIQTSRCGETPFNESEESNIFQVNERIGLSPNNIKLIDPFLRNMTTSKSISTNNQKLLCNVYKCNESILENGVSPNEIRDSLSFVSNSLSWNIDLENFIDQKVNYDEGKLCSLPKVHQSGYLKDSSDPIYPDPSFICKQPTVSPDTNHQGNKIESIIHEASTHGISAPSEISIAKNHFDTKLSDLLDPLLMSNVQAP